MGAQLLSEDPPRHTAMRNLVNRGFTPRRIAMWEPRVREFARACVNDMRHAEEIDLVAALAMPLPVRVICEILGVEPERRDDFKRWSDRIIAGTTGSTRTVDPLTSGFAEAMKELAEYIRGVVAQRTKQPSDDLISVLVAAQDGAGLSAAEMTMFVLLLLVAGNETTTNLIGNATNALLSHPSQLARVSADRSLVPSWIEETLRWDAPVQFVVRRTTADVEVAGQRLPANAHVVAILGSANRDERHWGPTAEQFDVTRNPQGHLAFGFGNHFCLGASLARLEARIALEALARRAAAPRTQRAARRAHRFLPHPGPEALPVAARDVTASDALRPEGQHRGRRHHDRKGQSQEPCRASRSTCCSTAYPICASIPTAMIRTSGGRYSGHQRRCPSCSGCHQASSLWDLEAHRVSAGATWRLLLHRRQSKTNM